jgi:hypothetical protein
MTNVSWFVVHGALVWQSLAVLAALAGIAAAWVLPRRALARRAERVREAIGTSEKSLDASARDKPVVLLGRVKLPAEALDETSSGLIAATLTPQGMELAEETSQKALTALTGGGPLVLEVDGQAVFVEGTPQILVGSEETGGTLAPKRIRLALWELASELRAMKNAPHGLRTIQNGDLVRVAGRLRHEPDARTPQTYRSGSGAYFLAAAEDSTKTDFVPVAFEGGPRPLARGRLLVSAQVVAAPLCALALLGAVGEVTIRGGEKNPTLASIASMTPFRRQDGLAALRAQADVRESPSEATLDRAAELDRVRGRCGAASDDYFFANRAKTAAEAAEGCGDPARAARAWFVYGDMERAAKAFEKARKGDSRLPPSLSEVTAYFTTERFDRAAEAGHALLAAWEGPRTSRDQLSCVVDALDHRAGGTHDLGNLAAHASEEGTQLPCTLLLADATEGEARKAVFENSPYDMRSPLLRAALGWPLVKKRDYYGGQYLPQTLGFSAVDLFTRPKQVVFAMPLALTRDAIRDARGIDDPQSMAMANQFSARQAAFLSFQGDLAGAIAVLDEAEARLEPFAKRSYTDEQKREWDSRTFRVQDVVNDDYYGYQKRLEAEEKRIRAFYDPVRDEAERHAGELARELHLTKVAVLARAGKVDEARALLPVALPNQVRSQDESLLLAFLNATGSYDPRALDVLARGDGREINRKLWLLAQAGDGEPLARKLRELDADGRGVVEIAGAHLPEGRGALALWSRYGYPAPCATCGLYPLVNALASHRDAAVAVGDQATVAELDALRERLAPVFAKREGALLLHFLSEISPP